MYSYMDFLFSIFVILKPIKKKEGCPLSTVHSRNCSICCRARPPVSHATRLATSPKNKRLPTLSEVASLFEIFRELLAYSRISINKPLSNNSNNFCQILYLALFYGPRA
jgi:hypothetical protein